MFLKYWVFKFDIRIMSTEKRRIRKNNQDDGSLGFYATCKIRYQRFWQAMMSIAKTFL